MWLTLLPISALVGVLVIAFALGAAPVFFIRLITLFYPPDDPRRAELIAEMAHIKGLGKTLDRFHWLGEVFATAAAEGTVARRSMRRRLRERKRFLRAANEFNRSQAKQDKLGQSVYIDSSGETSDWQWQQVPQDEYERLLARVEAKMQNVRNHIYLPED